MPPAEPSPRGLWPPWEHNPSWLVATLGAQPVGCPAVCQPGPSPLRELVPGLCLAFRSNLQAEVTGLAGNGNSAFCAIELIARKSEAVCSRKYQTFVFTARINVCCGRVLGVSAVIVLVLPWKSKRCSCRRKPEELPVPEGQLAAVCRGGGRTRGHTQ